MTSDRAPQESNEASVDEGVSEYLERELRKLRVLTGVFGGLLTVAILVLMVAGPRSLAYTEFSTKNLLKVKLQQIDRQMSEIDQILLRLRLYDAQMDSLATPRGDHGPLPESTFSNERLDQLVEDETLEARGTDIQPAESWADAVISRADHFLHAFESAEPDLNRVMAELEEFRALGRALPSIWPAEGKLTSGFGWRRNPFGRTWKFHSGIDIAGKRGTPIYSPARGKVSSVSYNSGYGRMLEIDHGFGIKSVYAHCNSIRVREGDEIKRGDLVATIGNTGRSTGPHLHFELRLDGHPVDPMDYLPRE